MNLWINRALYAVGILLLVLFVGTLYVNSGEAPVSAQSGCSMGQSDMSGCSMDKSSHGGSHGAHPTAKTGTPQHMITGTLIGVNKNTRTVSLRLDLPVDSSSAGTLSNFKNGDSVVATVALDKAGKPVVKALSPAGGMATLTLTGILCQACADKVQAALKAAPGVKQVTMAADPARAMVSYDPAKININALKAVVRNTEPIHAGTPFGVED